MYLGRKASCTLRVTTQRDRSYYLKTHSEHLQRKDEREHYREHKREHYIKHLRKHKREQKREHKRGRKREHLQSEHLQSVPSFTGHHFC